jgi:cyclopropane fatty-acyl-phospholipid synthase-like methyltransferase
VLEWGCGGGANAVAFAPISSRYIGVDISQSSIDECMRQLTLNGYSQSLCLLVDIGRPEGILSKVEPVDVVVCTYVFEPLLSKTYALRLIQVFFGLLKPGGVAFIQIRYATAKFSTRGRSLGYGFGFTKMVSFFLDEFWKACEIVGFSPKCLTLVPTDSTVFDERYAYFLLEKPRKA